MLMCLANVAQKTCPIMLHASMADLGVTCCGPLGGVSCQRCGHAVPTACKSLLVPWACCLCAALHPTSVQRSACSPHAPSLMLGPYACLCAGAAALRLVLCVYTSTAQSRHLLHDHLGPTCNQVVQSNTKCTSLVPSQAAVPDQGACYYYYPCQCLRASHVRLLMMGLLGGAFNWFPHFSLVIVLLYHIFVSVIFMIFSLYAF